MARIDKLFEKGSLHLQQGETALCVILGAYEGKLMGKKTLRTGVFIATDKRVIFYAKKLFGFDLESFPYSNISSFEHSKGMSGRTISFFSSGNKVSMKWINKGQIDKFMNEIQNRMGKKSEPATPITVQTPNATDELKKWAELKGEGLITEEEYATKKKQLLGM